MTVERLVEWAESDESLRAVLLVGSRGQPDAHPDRFADYDVILFFRDKSSYETDDEWLTALGSILVKLHDEYEVLGSTVATRLVRYRDGAKIDFSICDVDLLERISGRPRLPDLLDAGFRVLIDKDDWASRLPEPRGEAYRGDLPSEAGYQEVVNEFWWEVVYVATHLARGELLPALYNHESVIRFQCLVPMLEWYARVVHGSAERIGPYGRGLVRALEVEEVDRLGRTLLGPSLEEGWDALFETTEFFREVSMGVADQLGFATRDELAEGVEELLHDIREGGSERGTNPIHVSVQGRTHRMEGLQGNELFGDSIMSELFATGVGAVLSADIAVPDHEREVRFYSQVLSTGENPFWRGEDLMNNLGMPIIGLGERSAEYADLPLQWMPHIQVAEVAASVERAVDLGGSVLMHAHDDEGMSQWAVLLDPNGAAFGLIPTVPAEAISPGDGAAWPDPEAPVGRISWLDLTVSDATGTRAFYREVVGWSAQNVEMEDGGERYADYNMLDEAGNVAAGVCHARGVNLGLPPIWMIYLPVGDLSESLRRVRKEGGEVIKGVRGEDGEHLYAVIRDPVGAHLTLMQG